MDDQSQLGSRLLNLWVPCIVAAVIIVGGLFLLIVGDF